jgi:hypothetical protein
MCKLFHVKHLSTCEKNGATFHVEHLSFARILRRITDQNIASLGFWNPNPFSEGPP